VISAAEFVASSSPALAACLALAQAPDGRAHGGVRPPILEIDAETMVWKPILDWIGAHR
jgi:hypothetical protein